MKMYPLLVVITCVIMSCNDYDAAVKTDNLNIQLQELKELDYLFDGGSVVLTIEALDGSEVYVLISEQNVFDGNTLPNFYVTRDPKLKDKVELIEFSDLKKFYLNELRALKNKTESKDGRHNLDVLINKLEKKSLGLSFMDKQWICMRRIDKTNQVIDIIDVNN